MAISPDSLSQCLVSYQERLGAQVLCGVCPAEKCSLSRRLISLFHILLWRLT